MFFIMRCEFQSRCVEIFRRIILSKENHMDMRYEPTEILNRLARLGNFPSLIPIFFEILALDEYYFEDPYFAGHDYGASIISIDDCGFDPEYSEYWIIDIKELAITSLSHFSDQFELILNPLLEFMNEDYQIDEYIEAVACTLSSYISIIPHASKILLEKLDVHYNNNEGAKMIIDEILEFYGVENIEEVHQLLD